MVKEEVTNKPLNRIATDEPVPYVIYGKTHNLLKEPDLRRFKDLAKRDKKTLRLQNQAKLRSYRTSPKCKFDYQMSRNNDYERVLSIDKYNSNKKWAEAIKLDIDQQHEHDTYTNVKRVLFLNITRKTRSFRIR